MSDPYSIGEQIHRKAIRSWENTSPEERTPLPEANRGSWYCPCATERHERLIRQFASEINANRIYVLGAGDLRLSVALCDDYEVVSYETNELLADLAYEMHGQPDINLRTTDYYAHWDAMKDRNAVFAAIGKTNRLPGEPKHGVGLQGNVKLEIVFGDSDGSDE